MENDDYIIIVIVMLIKFGTNRLFMLTKLELEYIIFMETKLST